MESIIKNNVSGVIFPCIMEANDEIGHTIVLFEKSREGVCLYSSTLHNEIGQYKTTWGMSFFKPFNGEITLKN
jgi:hypothetical protein